MAALAPPSFGDLVVRVLEIEYLHISGKSRLDLGGVLDRVSIRIDNCKGGSAEFLVSGGR
jgi:hypothetical protein